MNWWMDDRWINGASVGFHWGVVYRHRLHQSWACGRSFISSWIPVWILLGLCHWALIRLRSFYSEHISNRSYVCSWRCTVWHRESRAFLCPKYKILKISVALRDPRCFALPLECMYAIVRIILHYSLRHLSLNRCIISIALVSISSPHLLSFVVWPNSVVFDPLGPSSNEWDRH